MKSISILASMIAIAGQYDLPSEIGRNNLRPEDIDITPPKKVISKGCKIYNINGKEIIAINEKSAQKKYEKKFGKI